MGLICVSKSRVCVVGKLGAFVDVYIKECDLFFAIFCCEFNCGVGLV